MHIHTRLAISFTLAAILLAGMAAGVSAQTTSAAPATAAEKKAEWLKNHPRRAEVNARLANQNKRITKEVQSGEITKPQAQALRANDRAVRAQERSMASMDGGHITRTDKAALNQELNKNSAAIGK